MTPRLALTSFLFGFALLSSSATEAAQQSTQSQEINYKPNIHGVMRTRWEQNLSADEGRWQVRNARVSLDGLIAPSIDYFIQADLCNRGAFQFLDAWGRFKLSEEWKFQAGQFRMPFGVDPFRSPANYIFTNRSFVGKQVCNVRAVGCKLSYSPSQLPLTLEGGVFSPGPITDHTRWSNDYAWGTRAIWLAGPLRFEGGFQSIIPDAVRINLVDGCVNFTSGRWQLVGEYMYKHYTHDAHPATHAWVAWTDYRMPVKLAEFNRLSFQARWDGMTDHSSGKRNADGLLVTNDPARNRATIGMTVSYIRRNVWLDIRANFEKYFYDHAAHPGQEATLGDLVGVEMVLRF